MSWTDALRRYKISWSAHQKPRVFMSLSSEFTNMAEDTGKYIIFVA